MTVVIKSPVYGKAVGETYTGPEEAWLIAQGYASNTDGGDAGTVPDDVSYAASFAPEVGNDNQTDYTGSLKADGFNHLSATSGGLATGVLPVDDPTLAANREGPYWPGTAVEPERPFANGDVEGAYPTDGQPVKPPYDFDKGGVNDEVPVFAAVVPEEGDIAGGTDVVITGTGFEGTTGVTFGGAAGTALVVVSDTEVHVKTPAHAVGAVAVVVTNANGSDTEAGAFTYTDEG